MEEGAEGGEAGQAGPPDADLTPTEQTPPEQVMSEQTDSEAVGSSVAPTEAGPHASWYVRAAPFVAVSVVALWLSRSFWVPGRYVVGFDTYAYSGPNIEVTEQAWRNFRLPILNELIFGGVPHLGNPSAGALYAPQLITLLFGTNRAMGILVTLHLVLLGVGMVWLLRRLGVGRIGSAAGGIALVASGAALTKSVQFEQILVIAWAPLLLVAIHAVLNSTRPWRPVAATSAVTAAVLLAGHPQLVYQTLLLAVAATIGFAIGGGRWRRLPHLVIGAALGGLIALPQLVAVLYATADSALSLGRTQNLLDPSLSLLPSATVRALLGTVQDIDPAMFVGSFESIAFVGVVGAVLAVIGVTESIVDKTTRPWAVSFAVLGGLALVWAIGPRTFVFDAAFDFLPGFDLARASARWLVVVVIVAALFVGVGVDVAVRQLRTIHLAAVAAAIVGVAFALVLDVVYADARTIKLWAAFALIAAVLVGIAWLVRRDDALMAGAAVIVLLAVGGTELVTMSLNSIPLGLTTDIAFTDHPSAAVDFLESQDQGTTIALTDDGREVAYEVPGFRPNANVLAGVPSIDGYDGGVQITKRWAAALQRFTEDPPTELPFRNSLQLPITPESMARLGVRFVMLDRARDPEVFIPGWMGPVAEDANVGVWENPAWIGEATAWPTVVESPHEGQPDDPAGDVQVADLLRLDPAGYEGVAIVDVAPEALSCTDPTIAGCAPVGLEVDRVTPEQLVVRTDLDRPAVLSVSRQALPGWQVEVDGAAATEIVVDGLLLGVEVPAGEHVVSWNYHSPWLRTTLVIAFLALVVTLVLAAAGDRLLGEGIPKLRGRGGR